MNDSPRPLWHYGVTGFTYGLLAVTVGYTMIDALGGLMR